MPKSIGGLVLLLAGLSIVSGSIVRRHAGRRPPGPITETQGPALRPIPQPRRFDDIAEASRIPPQQDSSGGADPWPPPPFLEMGDLRAPDCIVRDVSSTVEGGAWRWTYLEPTLQFYLSSGEGQHFVMDYSIVEMAFRSTGPVTLSCFINGHLLKQFRCPRPGNYHIDEPVPSSWLEGAQPVIVRAVLDKVWVAPADGARLGYVLIRAGFLDGRR